MTGIELIEKCEKELAADFKRIDDIAYFNQIKVLNAFIEHRVSVRHFNGTTGYGYDDDGRDCLGKLYAQVFGAESGIVSPHLLSGTHALTVALFGLLRPGDTLLCVSGMPYDTIRGVIFGENNGSLKDFGVKFDYCELDESGKMIYNEIAKKLVDSVKVVYIQRSRGYELRDAFSCEEIEAVCKFVRSLGYTGCIFVDNCYGEFVERYEPTEVGADIAVGSLIKNAGGGLAPSGGYICGKEKYIDLIGKRLTAPSIGLEVGSYEAGYRNFYQGLFVAPHTVAQSLKISLLIGKAMGELGYKNYPSLDKVPHDITRAIEFGSEEKMLDFIREVQFASPVDGYVSCEAWDMPGYDDQVIMAAGTFVSGASIELSADGPVKPPYIAYFQGGLTYEHGKYALSRMLDKYKSELSLLNFNSKEQNSQIFISYSSKESALVRKYVDHMKRSGLRCWMAPESIPVGQDYTLCIPPAIDSCKIFVLFLSDHSQNSTWVDKELIYAISKGKTIVPIKVGDFNLKNSYQFLFSNIQVISMTGDIDFDITQIKSVLKRTGNMN